VIPTIHIVGIGIRIIGQSKVEAIKVIDFVASILGKKDSQLGNS